MEPILGKWKEEAYVLMRIMMGFMICCHGVQSFSACSTAKAIRKACGLPRE